MLSILNRFKIQDFRFKIQDFISRHVTEHTTLVQLNNIVHNTSIGEYYGADRQY